jgi:hypothetical protein
MLTARQSARNTQAAGNKQSFLVGESEYVGEITPSASPAFSLQQFPVNPGQAGMFPWLSAIAKNFEKYEFESLAFEYKREVSEFATNGQTGKVIMSFDCDASDAAPTTKQQMEDTDPHVDCMPCENMRLVVPQRMLRRLTDAFFVRPGALPLNTDIKTYDLGVLNVACQGTAANTSVGELHVHYRLRLRIPVLEPGLGTSGAATISAAGGTVASPLLAGVAVTNGALAITQALTVISITGMTIGTEYILDMICQNAVTLTYGTFVGMTVLNYLKANGASGTCQVTVVATAVNGSFVMTASGALGATDFIVAQIPTSSF